MNSAIKAQWLAALRSGEYEQGQHKLRDGNAMCCLGVLCDIAAKAGIGAWNEEEFIINDGNDIGEVDFKLPPAAVQHWAELDAPNPLIEKENELRLALFNDGSIQYRLRPHTFAEIADLIETYL